jgi:hypothetical protein
LQLPFSAMRTLFSRIFLAFLIAWLPVSLAHAAAMGCHATGQQKTAEYAQHMQHERMHQSGARHAPSGCHACALCYSCAAMLPALAKFDVVFSEPRATHAAERFTSFFPDQPERPPRA